VVAAPAPRGGIDTRKLSDRAGAALSLGFVATFLSVVVALPIAALVWASVKHGGTSFWDAVTNPEALSAIKLSLAVAAIVGLVNAVAGTVIAWVLVRDDFRGKSTVNAVIDLPFALPTIVAGLLILTFYGPYSPVGINIAFSRLGVVFALLFVTLPFVVRTVQPVLIELDQEMEQAARSLGANELTTFRRIILPNILPGILSGVTMAFARAVGEIGSIVLIANRPFHTEMASVFILNHVAYSTSTAAAVSVVLLGISFGVLLLLGGVRRFATKHERS
jgi:sulfate transport system permease protein